MATSAASLPTSPPPPPPEEPKENEPSKSMGGPGYPPYAIIKKKKTPPSVSAAIKDGKKLRSTLKNAIPKRPARPIPQPAAPKGPMATDVQMSARQTRELTRCLRKYTVGLTERMQQLARPTRRQVLHMWRTYADVLTPEQIYNLSIVMDAADPFGPNEAYQFFTTLRAGKKKKKKAQDSCEKKKTKELLGKPHQAWARDATVAFARGLQQRLGRPAEFELEGSMLRLSDIVLHVICRNMKWRVPYRGTTNSKSKFVLGLADQIAVWMDEIIRDADERMLMTDADEDDEEVMLANEGPITKAPTPIDKTPSSTTDTGASTLLSDSKSTVASADGKSVSGEEGGTATPASDGATPSKPASDGATPKQPQ